MNNPETPGNTERGNIRRSSKKGMVGRMDLNGTNGMAEATYGMTDIPMGFGFALAMNEPAMGAYAALSEAEKEKLLMRCRDAKSKEEMQSIVNSLVTDTDLTGIREEERETMQ